MIICFVTNKNKKMDFHYNDFNCKYFTTLNYYVNWVPECK